MGFPAPHRRRANRAALVVAAGTLIAASCWNGPLYWTPCALARSGIGSTQGLFHWHSVYPTHTIELSGLGTFKYAWWGCYGTFGWGNHGGYYTLRDSLVILHSSAPTMWPLAGIYRYQRLIRWNDRLYMISEPGSPDEHGFLRLCNAINRGDEPRNAPGGRTEIYLRDQDWTKPVTGQPSLPQKWLTYLLPKPLNGKMVSVGGGRRATINIGRRRGLLPGMEVIDPRQPFYDLTVVAATEDTAEVEWSEWYSSAHFTPGDTISTSANPSKASVHR